MDERSTDLGHEQENQSDNAFRRDSAEDPDRLTMENRRLDRIDEFEGIASVRENPYAAMSGAGAADLQRIFDPFAKAILNRIDAGSKSFEEFQELTPEIRVLLNIRKEIDTDLAFQFLDAENDSGVFPRPLKRKNSEARPGTHFERRLPRR